MCMRMQCCLKCFQLLLGFFGQCFNKYTIELGKEYDGILCLEDILVGKKHLWSLLFSFPIWANMIICTVATSKVFLAIHIVKAKLMRVLDSEVQNSDFFSFCCYNDKYCINIEHSKTNFTFRKYIFWSPPQKKSNYFFFGSNE